MRFKSLYGQGKKGRGQGGEKKEGVETERFRVGGKGREE
jgi:hypothetical protein